MLDAAALAAILDPEHKQKYWWTYWKDWIYYGPPDLHTAREHCWRMEEWLEARGIGWTRSVCIGLPSRTAVHTTPPTTDPNHTAALVAAIERIANG